MPNNTFFPCMVANLYLKFTWKLYKLYLNYTSFCEVWLLKKAFDGARHKPVPYL